MKKILVATTLLASLCSANAQGLLGTNASVFESSFCKKWQCEFSGKAISKDGVESFTYTTVARDGWEYTFKVFRVKNIITSSVVGGIDPPESYTDFMADWITTFTGNKITKNQVPPFLSEGGSLVLPGGNLQCVWRTTNPDGKLGPGGASIKDCWLKLK